jgi:sirohydrochlorin cobaltochelatase
LLTNGMKKNPVTSTPARSASEGLILFAHGSRNAAWRKPFDRLLKDVTTRGECQAILAFGEFMSPGLVEAAQALAAKGVKNAVIVPLFLGGGLHVRGDLPKLAVQARAASGLRLRVARAIGDDAGVLKAIVDYSITAVRPRTKATKVTKATSARRKPS